MPFLYYIGQNNKIFNYSNLVFYLLHSIIVGTLMFLVIIYTFQYSYTSIDGYTGDIWYMSLTTYSCVLLIVDFRLAVITKTWT